MRVFVQYAMGSARLPTPLRTRSVAVRVGFRSPYLRHDLGFFFELADIGSHEMCRSSTVGNHACRRKETSVSVYSVSNTVSLEYN